MLTTSVCYQITWELQLTSEELEIDIIKELIAAQNDRTDVSKPEYLSSIMLTVDVSSFP